MKWGFNTVSQGCKDDLDTVLGVPEGVCSQQDQANWWGDALWEGLQDAMWDWLWLEMQWYKCLPGEWLKQHLWVSWDNLPLLELLWPLEALYHLCVGCCRQVFRISTFTEGCELIASITVVAVLSLGWTLVWGVGIATFAAVGSGIKGISMHWGGCWGHYGYGGEVGPSLLLGLLDLLTFDSSSLQWVRRELQVSWEWSWSQIQSLASWYPIACCRTMLLKLPWSMGGWTCIGW